jgi:hypothetical protein
VALPRAKKKAMSSAAPNEAQEDVIAAGGVNVAAWKTVPLSSFMSLTLVQDALVLLGS